MTKKKSKPAEKDKLTPIDEEPSVKLVEEVIPPSPPEELAENEAEAEETTVEAVVSDVVEGMVTATALTDLGFIDPVDGDVKRFKKGETFTTTRERAESLDPKAVEIV